MAEAPHFSLTNMIKENSSSHAEVTSATQGTADSWWRLRVGNSVRKEHAKSLATVVPRQSLTHWNQAGSGSGPPPLDTALPWWEACGPTCDCLYRCRFWAQVLTLAQQGLLPTEPSGQPQEIVAALYSHVYLCVMCALEEVQGELCGALSFLSLPGGFQRSNSDHHGCGARPSNWPKKLICKEHKLST